MTLKNKYLLKHFNSHWCSKCNTIKNISEFGKLKTGTYRAYCNTCVEKESKDRYANHKDKMNASKKAWEIKNHDKVIAAGARRRAKLLNAIPEWVNHEELELIYADAIKRTQETGIDHAVDHIIPLNNKLICGLHVPWNLQVITKTENSKKKNKLV